MGWYWPAIVNDYASGNEAAARQKLQRLVDAIGQLVLADGSIKDRTTRGDRAIWYHYTSLGKIVVSLEFARAAGIKIPARLEERLHKAVSLFIGAIEDPATIEPWAEQAHNARYDGYQDRNFTAGRTPTSREAGCTSIPTAILIARKRGFCEACATLGAFCAQRH